MSTLAGRQPRKSRLDTVYYDTPDLRLQRAGAALRLRRAGHKWLQTLKVPQGPQGALASRAEWEVAAPKGRLDCKLFPREAVRAASGLDIVRLARRLRPMFATRFERRSGPLALGHGVRAEACIDRGVIEAGAKREDILELELELKEGEIGPLVGLAEGLVQLLGLRIETASKAERGYRLSESAGLPPPAKWSQPPIAENATASTLTNGMIIVATSTTSNTTTAAWKIRSLVPSRCRLQSSALLLPSRRPLSNRCRARAYSSWSHCCSRSSPGQWEHRR